MDTLVPFAAMIGTIFLRTEKREIILDWSRVSNPGLVLDDVKDLVDRELQRSEAFH